MNYRLIEFTLGEGQKPRWRVAPIDGGLPHGVPSIGWATEKMARRWVEKNKDRIVEVKRLSKKAKDSSEDSTLVSRIAEKYAMDAIFPTSKGFANEKGLLKRDTRKGLKPYEVTFVVKGKDGRPFNTKRSKMAASIEEAKKWAQAESKKYNGVTKIDVKEFKDSADDFASDAMDRIRAKYCLDATKDQSNKKRYEVHYQATAPDGAYLLFHKGSGMHAKSTPWNHENC